MRIAAAQRIERPRHLFDVSGQSSLPLSEFQLVAEVAPTVGGAYRQHMGMKARSASLQTRKRQGKANQLVVIKGSEPHTAGGFQGNGQSKGDDVGIVESPNLPFQRSEERRVGKECRSRWS